MSELHPYISRHFDSDKNYKYLIVGTFPPNKTVREDKKAFADYFYGNKGTLWKIIEEIYPAYQFSKAKKEFRVEKIKAWQEAYNVGITDTIVECSRRDINSSDDADLIIEWGGYNHSLKEYLLKRIDRLERVLFTSSTGCNSAFETFKIIMGDQLVALPKEKLITDLPSPSGSSNTAMFNVNTEGTLGLHPKLFEFISTQRAQHIPSFQERWKLKKQMMANKSKNKLPPSPRGLLKEFKVWSYKKVLPTP